MPDKTTPLSARVSDEDAEFLARLSIPEARTPSDKLRYIIAQARKRQAGMHDYPAALEMMRELFDAVQQRLREQERQQGLHSELLFQSFDWLTDLAAFVLSGTDQESGNTQEISLEQLEAGVTDRLFRMMEQILRLGITPDSPCYDTAIINRNLPRVLPLTKIIEQTR